MGDTMDVKSKIASFEKHNEVVRTIASPLSPGDKDGSTTGTGLVPQPYSPASALSIHIASASLESPSPDRPLSTTSFASQNRKNRLQRQAGGGTTAIAVGPTQTLLRAPQPPPSPARSMTRQQRQTHHARKPSDGDLAPVPGPSASLFSYRKPKASNSGQQHQGTAQPLLPSHQQQQQQTRALVQPRPISETSLPARRYQGRTEYESDTPVAALSESVLLPEIGHHQQQQQQRDDHDDDHHHHPSEEETSPTRRSTDGRMAKVQRIKKIRNLDHVRRRSRNKLASQQQQLQQQQQQQQYSPNPAIVVEALPPPPSSPLTLQATPSVDPNDTDDDKTLTSVRQIVGNTYDESPKSSSQHDFADQGLSPGPSDRMWMDNNNNNGGEEKSDKAGRGGLMIARSSSTEYDSDGDSCTNSTSRIDSALYGEEVPAEPSSSVLSSSHVTPAEAALLGQNRRKKSRKSKADRDNTTFDYGDRDEDSAESLSYEQRRQKEAKEKEAREAAVAAAKAQMEGNGPFVQTQDVEHFRKSLDTPILKTAAGIAGAATLGCILLGPVGLMIGAAAVGIGIGVLQIPEEQRSHLQDKASETVHNVQESALNASETISNSCAASYKESEVAKHVPIDVDTCCTGGEEEIILTDNELVDEPNMNDKGLGQDSQAPSPQRAARARDRKERVAVLQEGQFVPVNLIHSLNPSEQPRGWLDVLASAHTSDDEKAEAMEEILILAKDKKRARDFLEDGILDPIMWIIGRYDEKLGYNATTDVWTHPGITPQEHSSARLAASCCLTLGKSHCAAIHTEGDLLLMSLYERGTVPEERQLAQMLHEVPFHARATITKDPTIIYPDEEVFVVKQMSLPQAEELAREITALAQGRL